jgi:hypothetical protein
MCFDDPQECHPRGFYMLGFRAVSTIFKFFGRNYTLSTRDDKGWKSVCDKPCCQRENTRAVVSYSAGESRCALQEYAALSKGNRVRDSILLPARVNTSTVTVLSTVCCSSCTVQVLLRASDSVSLVLFNVASTELYVL